MWMLICLEQCWIEQVRLGRHDLTSNGSSLDTSHLWTLNKWAKSFHVRLCDLHRNHGITVRWPIWLSSLGANFDPVTYGGRSRGYCVLPSHKYFGCRCLQTDKATTLRLPQREQNFLWNILNKEVFISKCNIINAKFLILLKQLNLIHRRKCKM